MKPEELKEILTAHAQWLSGDGGERADLREANLRGADLYRANLRGANLYRAKLPTGETWEEYLAETVPALLVAGGKTLAEVTDPKHWECHQWDNCPMAAAFDGRGLDDVPILLRPRAEQFIQFFDAGLIPADAVVGAANA